MCWADISMKQKFSKITQFLFRQKKLTLLIIVILVIAGYFIRRTYFPSTSGIESTKVEKGVVREELILSGEIKAEEHANLSFLTPGSLDYVGVTEGQEVKKGHVLAKLDTAILYQTYLSAEADLRRYGASRDKTYDDVQGHAKDETFAQKETRTIAETNRDKAYRAYVAAQENLANASLRAPFDGVITSITHPYTGVNTSLTESQIEIVNPETLYFEVSADQTEVTDLKMGQKVNVVLDSFASEELQGEIAYIGYTPKIGEVGTAYRVKVKMVSQTDTEKIRIGMSGDSKFVLSETGDVLYVPPKFIKTDVKGKYVKKHRKNNKIYVEVGVEGEDRVEIKGDIKEGDLVYD